MTGSHTLRATEDAVQERLSGLDLDNSAMWAVSNIYRATTAIRNHLEQSVLRDTGLTWTGFVVLWVVWIWGDMETAGVAKEAGISKATLTGVAKTLESRRYVQRVAHPTDGRRVVLTMTKSGTKLMQGLFPKFNREESYVVRGLSDRQRRDLANHLRTIVAQLEDGESPGR
jgi:DNA-binding MarR family transcriptional regulator